MLHISAALRSRLEKLGKLLGIVVGAWFWAALVCMFLEKRYPGLHPFVIWTFRFYFGLFIAAGGAIVIVGPGVYAAKELFELVEEPTCSRLESYLTWAWAGLAGLLLTVLLAIAAVMIMFGLLAYVKLWFIGLCWLALLIPWGLVGCFGRRLVRHFRPLASQGGGPPNSSLHRAPAAAHRRR